MPKAKTDKSAKENTSPRERARVKKPTVSVHVVKSEMRDIKTLIPYARNSKQHSPEQVQQIADSIQRFGFINPIAVWKNEIVAGHGRVLACELLIATGKPEFQYLKTLPIRTCDHMTDAERRAYTIADNKLAEGALWDDAMLASELKALLDAEFDISLTGFDEKEALNIIEEELDLTSNEDKEDEIPTVPKKPITKKGDIIVLGKHRLMCGDATEIENVKQLIGNVMPGACFTDPPYGIALAVNNGKIGNSKKGRYRKVIGDENGDVAHKALAIVQKLSVPTQFFWGANHYGNMPPSPCWLSWDKQGGKHVTYADIELCYTNLQQPARMFTHIWDGFRRDSERGEDRVHPTQKPVKLIEDIFDMFEVADKVLDLFGGSGSTLIACEKTKRMCYMMEIDAHYCDVIIKRWENFTGKKVQRLPRD